MAAPWLSGVGWSASVDEAAGTFDVTVADATLIKGAGACVFLPNGDYLSSSGGFDSSEMLEDGYSFEKELPQGRLLFRARAAGRALVLEAGLRAGADELEVDRIMPLRVPAGGIWPEAKSTRAWRFYDHGYQCWTPTASLKRSRPGDFLIPTFFPKRIKPMLLNPSTPVSSDRGRFESEWVGGIADVDAGRSLVAGFIGVSRALSLVSGWLPRVVEECRLEAASLHEGKLLAPGQELWSEPLAIVPGDLTAAPFEEYADQLAGKEGVSVTRSAPTGWCSWYHYYTKVTAADIDKTLDLLDGHYSSLGVKLLQVDDGYDPAVGDWLVTNESFPEGMKAVADSISARGMVPGVWLAPFTVARKSKLFKDKRDWLVTGRRGRPVLAGYSPDWGGRFYGLDLTNDEVLDYIREVFTTFHSYGFRFFKIDFLATGLLEGKRSDPDMTRAEAARRALSAIRESIGDSHLMAAGGPVLLGAGILDSQRVSGDVAPAWRHWWQSLIRDRSTPGTRNSLLNTLERSYLSGRVFEGDPDCMMARSHGSDLTLDERRAMGSVMSVFGGSFLFSDDMATWQDEERELMSKLLPHGKGTCGCPDIWRREVPHYLTSWRSDPSGRYLLAAVINWTSSKRDVKVPMSELGTAEKFYCYEFWTGEYLGVTGDQLVCPDVPKHGCALLRLTPVTTEPVLVGSDVNASMGAVELRSFGCEEGSLAMEVAVASPRKASLLLALPGIPDARCDDGTVELTRARGDTFKVVTDIEEEKRVEISFERGQGGS